MDRAIDNKAKFKSLKLLDVAFILIILTTFYAPKILDRDYLGIIALFGSFAIVILFRKIAINKLTILILTYVVYTIVIDLISNFNYPTPPVLIIRTFIYGLVPLIAYILGNFFSNRINENLFNKLILITGLIQALVGVAQIYNETIRGLTLKYYADFEKYNYTFEAWDVGRVVGTIGNPNTFGVFMAIFGIFILTVLIPKNRSNKKYTFSLVITLIITVYAIILSQSRTAYILLAFGIVISMLFSKKNIILKYIILFFLSMIFILIYFYVPFVSNRFEAENGLTFGGRMHIWKAFIANYLSPFDFKNLVGYGFYYVRDIGKAVDNYYLQLLLQYGIIGLLLYLNIFLYTIKSFLSKIRVSKYRNFIISATSIILISDITGTINMSPDILTFYFLMLGYYFNK